MHEHTFLYEHTFCSQCGKDLGPGDNGLSHCSDHLAPETIERRLERIRTSKRLQMQRYRARKKAKKGAKKPA